MSSRTIRQLEPGDIEAIVDIALAAWEPIYTWYRRTMGEELFHALFPDWRQGKGDQVRSACKPEHPAKVFVAEETGKAVGFVTFYMNTATRVGEIGNNAVHPDFQGQGIGREMYEFAFERMREGGMRFVKVSTGGDPSHAPARRAYEKAGFTVQLPGVDYYREL